MTDVLDRIVGAVAEREQVDLELAVREATDPYAHGGSASVAPAPPEVLRRLDALGYKVIPKNADLTVIVWTDEDGDPRFRVGLLDEEAADSVVELLTDQFLGDVHGIRVVQPVVPMLPSDFLADWQDTVNQRDD